MSAVINLRIALRKNPSSLTRRSIDSYRPAKLLVKARQGGKKLVRWVLER